MTGYMMEHFGKRFRQWMEEKGTTLMEMARDLRLSYTNLYSFGAPPPVGRMPSPENAGLIAEYLGVPREEFFSAMGQVDPLLLEKVTPLDVEEGFLQLHRFLMERAEAATGVPAEDPRRRKWLRLFERISKDFTEDQFDKLLEHIQATARLLKATAEEKAAKKESAVKELVSR